MAQGSRNATQYQQVVREAEALRAEYTKKLNAVTEELNASKQIIEKLKADNANICRDAMSAKANYEKEFADLKVIFLFHKAFCNIIIIIDCVVKLL